METCIGYERGDLLKAVVGGVLALYLLKNAGRRAADSRRGGLELVEKVGRKDVMSWGVLHCSWVV